MKKYLIASGLAMLKTTLGGMSAGFLQIAHFADVALQQTCEDMNEARRNQLGISADENLIKLDPEDLN